MRQIGLFLGAIAVAVTAAGALTFAQAPQGGQPQQPMSFFVTSVGKGDGANYGGLAGADAARVKAIALKNCRNVTLRDFSMLHGGHFDAYESAFEQCAGVAVEWFSRHLRGQ